MMGKSGARDVAESEMYTAGYSRNSWLCFTAALLSTGVNTSVITMDANAPTPASSNNSEQAKDDSPNADTFQKPTGSPGPTSRTNVDQSDSEQPQQHDDYPADPQVVALRAIFPDYDDGLL